MSYDEYNDIPPERKKELERKVAKMKRGFSLPPEISVSKTLLQSGRYAYVYRHRDLGDLGRVTIIPRSDGQSQLDCEVAGDESDPMTAKRKEILAPLAMDIMNRISEELPGTGEAVPVATPGEKVEISHISFPCERCGEATAMFILSEGSTRGELEDSARLTFPKIRKTNVPAWVLGREEEIVIDGERMGQALVMKIWPEREEPKIATSKYLNAEAERLMKSHCGE